MSERLTLDRQLDKGHLDRITGLLGFPTEMGRVNGSRAFARPTDARGSMRRSPSWAIVP
jgi:hypothetical protein